MTGKHGTWAVESLEIVRGEWLADYLAEQGLEVVRGHWLRGAPYPVLFVRPKPSAPAPRDEGEPPALRARLVPEHEREPGANDLCRCGHRRELHDSLFDKRWAGFCWAWECDCGAFAAPAAGGAS